MACRTVVMGDGVLGIVCSRGERRKLCKSCKSRWATKACDFPLAGSKAGKTCDRDVCDACAVTVGTHADGAHKGETIDYCPTHANQKTLPGVK